MAAQAQGSAPAYDTGKGKQLMLTLDDKLFEVLDWLVRPRRWPKCLRRVYVGLFPLTVPFHWFSVVALGLLGFILWCILGPIRTLVRMWQEDDD